MALIHPQLRQSVRAAAFRVTHPASFDDTLIVDGDTGQKVKGVDTTELGHAVVVWLCCTGLAVLIPALVLGVSWADMVEFIALIGGA